MKEKLIEEFQFCLDLWQKQGHCTFGISTKCETCASPYLLYKLISNDIVHEKRLSLEEWKEIAKEMTLTKKN